VAVVRDIDAYMGTIVLPQGIIAVGPVGNVFWQETITTPGITWVSWRGRQVFYAGEGFSMQAGEVADLMASGYLLKSP
jgi:hypothetical protein